MGFFFYGKRYNDFSSLLQCHLITRSSASQKQVKALIVKPDPDSLRPLWNQWCPFPSLISTPNLNIVDTEIHHTIYITGDIPERGVSNTQSPSLTLSLSLSLSLSPARKYVRTHKMNINVQNNKQWALPINERMRREIASIKLIHRVFYAF